MKLRIGTEIFHVRAEEMSIKKRLIKAVRPNRIPVFIFKNAQTKYIKAVWSDKYSFGSKKRQRKLPPPVVCNVSLLCIWLLFQLIINSSIYMYFNLFSALLRKTLRKIKVQKNSV